MCLAAIHICDSQPISNCEIIQINTTYTLYTHRMQMRWISENIRPLRIKADLHLDIMFKQIIFIIHYTLKTESYFIVKFRMLFPVDFN